MNNNQTSFIPFSVWAKKTQVEYHEIIEQWLNGNDPYKRAIAKTILEAAGVA